MPRRKALFFKKKDMFATKKGIESRGGGRYNRNEKTAGGYDGMDVRALIRKMTLEEKAGLCSGLDSWHTKPVGRLGVPSVMVSDGPYGLRKQVGEGANDSIRAVCFPTGCAMAASFDRSLFERLGDALGRECRAEGVAVVLGPAINIKRSPLCGRNFEYLSEDPYLAGEEAAAYVAAVQRHDVGVSVKHFALNNQEHRRMSQSSEADERTMREIYLAAFETVVKKAKPWTLMCAYNRINGVLASENHWLLTDVLRNEWGFDGYVMSDWGAVGNRVKGLSAGLELEMPSSGGVRDEQIVSAVRSGELDEAVLDCACERMLAVHARYLGNGEPAESWDREADDALSGELAEACMVLLKNAGVLPLDKGARVAFIGEFAKEPRFQGGGSSHINAAKITSALDAAKEIPNVRYARGFSIERDETTGEWLRDAADAAANAQVAVVFAGLPDAYECEGYDRAHMRLPDCQNRLIETVAAANPNTVVVLQNGSPVEMPWISRVKGVLEAYLSGQASGRAVVRILFGDANPSGRLPETFPKKLEDNPSYLFFGGDDRKTEYREGAFVGYRYYDKKKMDVLFPFGHGLSYTTFAYGNLSLDKREMDDSGTLTVTVDVTNTGERSGSEVVQLYVADVESTAIRPVRELKGFETVALEPGETKTVSFALDGRAFAYYETRLHDWHVESGEFMIQIGRSSRDIVLEAAATVRSTREIPVTFDENSILMDVLASEKGKRRAEHGMPDILQAMREFSENDDETETAREAITQEMSDAMLNYMPLRAVFSFSPGKVTKERLDEAIRDLNK